MARVHVTPETFTLVFYDAAQIADVAERVANDAGLPADTEIFVEVIEETPPGQVTMQSLDPIRMRVEGGAFEDPKRPRRPSEAIMLDTFARTLFRVADRREPAFADAPVDDKVSLAEAVAWDAYSVGRATRLGYPTQRQRRLYAFRNRHGFTDVADAAFEQLWTAPSCTWAEIVAICAETEAAKPK